MTEIKYLIPFDLVNTRNLQNIGLKVASVGGDGFCLRVYSPDLVLSSSTFKEAR